MRIRPSALTIATLCLLLVVVLARKPAFAGQFSTPSGATLNATLLLLDRAIHELRNPSADYEAILRRTVRDMPGGAEDATAGIRAFLERLPRAGDEFRCSADFARDRARKTLRRLREKLLNEAPSPLDPAVCYALPFALSATPDQAVASLNLYGFDLDTITPQLILVTSGGFTDVTSALVVRSHFHLVVKLGSPGGVDLAQGSRSLGIAWGHLIRYSVPVLRPDSRLCSSRIESIPAGKSVSYRLPPAARSTTYSSLGTISADVALEYSSNKLEATMCVTTANPAASGCGVEFLYTTDADRVIDGVVGAGMTSEVSSDRGRPPGRRNPADPVRQWIFSRFQTGDAAGGAALVTARLGRISIVSSEDNGCIAPAAYAEARRQSPLDAGTRSALDPQLRGIDQEIVKLRPRFAPIAP